ncbi:MAG: valine--tRNA ligase [Myxococcota bacterium]|nr:valine--tRNA ligase [Myxococcota bacterium]
MTAELPKRYDPAALEASRYAAWEAAGHFAADENSDKKPFTIVLPPPNVTGSLHVGHALTAAVQDTLIRYKRMTGYEALWLPGTDHAGIATQMVVERDLERRGEPGREALGREAFLEKVWQWKATNGTRIQEQHRILGASLDWQRERFTLDEGFSSAVTEAFVRLYDEGLIYRAERLINWSPGLKTSLSDLEVEHKDAAGHLWHLAYPVSGSDERLVVATTRPETMLGDTAVAVHPSDERYAHLIGKTIDLPLTERKIPIIADAVLVNLEFGSGAVKVTPAHDFNDFQTGKRHDLPLINVLDEGAHVSLPGPYLGLHVDEARKAVVADLDALGLLVKVEDHAHSVGHCSRSGSVVEPRLSLQWFVSTKPLAAKAMDATRKGETQIVPQRFESTWYHWMENIQDWCISRQLWWGHRIPAWHAGDQVFVARSEAEALEKAKAAGFEPSELRRDEDVLDTWFSSGLWPMGTLGWPEKTPELEKFYPTDVLETGHDILFFWVARMMMLGIHFTGKAPFHTIFLHGMVRDAQGQKMSKSKENVIDPVEITNEYGADALRLGLLLMAAPGRDIKMNMQRIEGYRNFLTKVWNATRFAQTYLVDCQPSDWQAPSGATERWIRSRLAATQDTVKSAFAEYRLDEAGQAIYHFIWHELCDWYIELAKRPLRSDDELESAAARAALADALSGALRMLHPFCPFVTEELWAALPLFMRDAESLSKARFEVEVERDPAAESQIALAIEAVGLLRALRGQMGIKPREPLAVRLQVAEQDRLQHLDSAARLLVDLAAAESVETGLQSADKPRGWAVATGEGLTLLANLSGKVDVAAESERLQGDLDKNGQEIGKCKGKLGNQRFVARAPEAVVAEERRRLVEFERRDGELRSALNRLAELEA